MRRGKKKERKKGGETRKREERRQEVETLTRKMISKTERHLRIFEKLGFKSIFFLVKTKTQRMFPGGENRLLKAHRYKYLRWSLRLFVWQNRL